MNAVSTHSNNQVDWVINYVEVNSRPIPTDGFRRLRMTNNELRIDPANIILTFRERTDEGIVLDGEHESYVGKIAQRGNELIVNLTKSDDSQRLMFIAKKSVCQFEPEDCEKEIARQTFTGR